MSLKTNKYDHHLESFAKALGFKDEDIIRAREVIIFSCLSTGLQVLENYNDPDDAPKEIRTSSGEVQLAVTLIRSVEEYEVFLLYYQGISKICKLILGKTAALKEAEKSGDKEDAIKFEILKGIMKLKKMAEREKAKAAGEDDEPDLMHIGEDDLDVRIEKIKEANFNFDKYLYLLNIRSSPKKVDDGFVDDLLKNMFKN